MIMLSVLLFFCPPPVYYPQDFWNRWTEFNKTFTYSLPHGVIVLLMFCLSIWTTFGFSWCKTWTVIRQPLREYLPIRNSTKTVELMKLTHLLYDMMLICTSYFAFSMSFVDPGRQFPLQLLIAANWYFDRNIKCEYNTMWFDFKLERFDGFVYVLTKLFL